MAASMAALLLCAGTKGKRFALPNSDIMIHQVSGGAQAAASDVERQVDYMFKLKKRLIKIIAQHTGKSEEQVRIDSDRDYYMSAQEAKTYGLVDEVIKSRKKVKLLDGATPPSGDPSVAVAEAALPRKAGGYELLFLTSKYGPGFQPHHVLVLWQEPRRGAQINRRARRLYLRQLH